VIVLVLGLEVLMERLIFWGEPALLVTKRASGVMLPIEDPRLGIKSLVALLVFLAKLVMDPPMRPAVMSKGQRSRQQQPREG